MRLALAMDIIPAEISPLLDAIGSLRNKVLHDNPKQGSISESDVAKLLNTNTLLTRTTEEAAKLDALRDKVSSAESRLAALEPHQRDLRFALLIAYAACRGAATQAAPKVPTPGN